MMGYDTNELLRDVDAIRKQLSGYYLSLVACGVVALANDRDTAAEARDSVKEFWCPSVEYVAAAVDREIENRERAEKAEAEVTRLTQERDEARVEAKQLYDALFC